MRRKIDRCNLDLVTKQSVVPMQIPPVLTHEKKDEDVGGKNRGKYKPLYSYYKSGIEIRVRCYFNEKTGHIGIHTSFESGQTWRRQKVLYMSNNQEGAQISTRCDFNEKTGHIGIYTTFQKQAAWNGGAATNPSCSIYLGVMVAEQMLSKVFKNVQRMPVGNIGYDFICNNGFKIDVKAACTRKNRLSSSWAFAIRRNHIADYFLCIAFDNREDLIPQHIWLVPASVLNSLTTASVAQSTINKWAQYELIDKLDDVLTCCDAMKQHDYPNN